MLINSVTHVVESALQYMALIIALMVYRWLKAVSSHSRFTHASRALGQHRHILRSRSTRAMIYEELFILYQWVRRLRKKHNLTQEKLAEKLGVDPRTVQRWESGKTRPHPYYYSSFQELEEDQREMKPSLSPPPLRMRSRRNLWRFILIAFFVELALTFLAVALYFWLHLI